LGVIAFSDGLEQPVTHEYEVEKVNDVVAVGVAVKRLLFDVYNHRVGRDGGAFGVGAAVFHHNVAAEGDGVFACFAEIERPIGRVVVNSRQCETFFCRRPVAAVGKGVLNEFVVGRFKCNISRPACLKSEADVAVGQRSFYGAGECDGHCGIDSGVYRLGHVIGELVGRVVGCLGVQHNVGGFVAGVVYNFPRRVRIDCLHG